MSVSRSSLSTVSPVALGAGLMLLIDPGLSELKNFAPTIIIVLIVAWSTLKIVPLRKEVRMRELDVQEKGIAAQVEIAVAVTKLADASERIAVDQRQATEIIEVAQRVNVNSNEKVSHAVDEVTHAVDGLVQTIESLNARIDKIEAASAAAAAGGKQGQMS
jgi:hypothetical protein